MQDLVVAGLVAGCMVYAVWTLMPRALRGRLAQALLQWPLPGVLQRLLQAAVRRQTGCGCSGCDQGSAPPAVKPVLLVRKPPPGGPSAR